MLRTTVSIVLAIGVVAGCSSPHEPVVVSEIEIPADHPNAAQMKRIADQILLTPTSEADAIALIEAEGFSARVVERDGEQFAMTMDYRFDRFNLTVTDDRITAMTVG